MNPFGTVAIPLADGNNGYATDVMMSFPTWGSNNFGSAGASWNAINSQMTGQVDPLIDASRDQNIIVAWGGTNDIYTLGTDPTTLYNAQKANLQTQKDISGVKVVVLSMLPRGTSAPDEADRITFNGLLQADFNVATSDPNVWLPAPGVTYADVLVDVGRDPLIGLPGSQNNLSFYLNDKIHLRDHGYRFVANHVINAIASIP